MGIVKNTSGVKYARAFEWKGKVWLSAKDYDLLGDTDNIALVDEEQPIFFPKVLLQNLKAFEVEGERYYLADMPEIPT